MPAIRRFPTVRVGLAALVGLVVLVGLVAPACRGDRSTLTRADQVREAALHAGLSAEVADVLALAARGTTATFQVTYAGAAGASLTVSQEPPNRRIDVLTAGLVVQSQVVRGPVAYRCAITAGGRPGDDLDCTRTHGALPGVQAFSEDALAAFADELLDSVDQFDLSVETRHIAEVEATCLIAAPNAGPSVEERGHDVDTLCLSAEGAQLILDTGGERVEAETYATEVPEGTFNV